MKQPRFYFSFRSPYSWLAARALNNRAPQTLELIPYWEPDPETCKFMAAAGAEFLYREMPKEKRLYVLQDIRRLTAKMGVKITWPVDSDPHWEVPHHAFLAGRHQDASLAWRFLMEIYELRFERGQDVTDIAVIHAACQRTGWNADAVIRALKHPNLHREGAELLSQAYRDGVFGPPFFVNGYERFWGVDRVEAFLNTLTASSACHGVPDAVSTEEQSFACCALEDHAGGCGLQ